MRARAARICPSRRVYRPFKKAPEIRGPGHPRSAPGPAAWRKPASVGSGFPNNSPSFRQSIEILKASSESIRQPRHACRHFHCPIGPWKTGSRSEESGPRLPRLDAGSSGLGKTASAGGNPGAFFTAGPYGAKEPPQKNGLITRKSM